MAKIFQFFTNILPTSLSFFPSWFALALIAALGLVAIIIIVKLIAFILDAIPFL